MGLLTSEKMKRLDPVGAAEVVGAAGAIAYINHRYGAGELKVAKKSDGTGGVPVDGLGFLVGKAAAFFTKGKTSEHLSNVANGLGAGFAYRFGAEKGDSAATAAASGGATTAGQLVGAGNVHLLRPMPGDPRYQRFQHYGHHGTLVGRQGSHGRY